MAGTARRSARLKRLARAALWGALGLMLILLLLWWLARPAAPGAFYAASVPPRGTPGMVLRREAFSRDVPAAARAWRILYTTVRANGRRAVASALVLVPQAPSSGPRPVIAWAHGTTGVRPGCAPSVMAHPFANVPALEAALAAGWAVVATDYPGLGTGGGHAYMIGDDAARAVLDSVRAARRLPGLALNGPVVVWGHSQGGNSALWTGMTAAAYAPDLPIAGIAALAPASDLVALVRQRQGAMFGTIVSAYILDAYASAYPDVRKADYLSWWTQGFAGDLASRCVGGIETLFSAAETTLLPGGLFTRDPGSGALGARLIQNTPGAPVPVPLLIAQGAADDLVLPEIQRRYVAGRCAAGQRLDYRVYPGRDHISLVASGSPLESDLVRWTAARFAAEPSVSTCQPSRERPARSSS